MYRILVADDEIIEMKVVCKVIKDYFKDNCKILEAGNGREAMDVFRNNEIQIAIMDIEMPGINGLEASSNMKMINPDCVIIFLTAFEKFDYAKKALEIHAFNYLLKPYRDEELIAEVQSAMKLVDSKDRTASHTAFHERVNQSDSSSYINKAENASMEENMEKIRMEAIRLEIEEYLTDNYSCDISLQDVAKAMNYSDAYFCRLFKKCFQCNFTQYLMQIRVEKAKELLAKPTVNVKDVGSFVGYVDANYFTKVFKKMTNMNPSEYRSSVLNN